MTVTTIFVTHDQEEANTTSARMAVLNNGVLQQVGAPMELYDAPANAFAASFLGTASILKGEVRSDGGSTLFVSEKGLALPLAGLENSNKVIAIRPQNIKPHRGDAQNDGSALALSGVIDEMEFLGSTLRYAVKLGQETLLVDHSHKPGESIFAVDDSVRVEIDPSQFVALQN